MPQHVCYIDKDSRQELKKGIKLTVVYPRANQVPFIYMGNDLNQFDRYSFPFCMGIAYEELHQFLGTEVVTD